MRKLIQTGLAITAFAAAIPAHAGTFAFDTVDVGTSSGNGFGNSYTYTTATSDGATINMKVSGWSLGVDNSIAAGKLQSWGKDGLGIYQAGESTDYNLHQIDNQNGWEFAVLQFDRAVTLTSGVFNPFTMTNLGYADSDAFISGATLGGAWNQNLTAATFGSLLSTFQKNGINTDNTKFSTNLQTFTMPAGTTGNIWIVGGSYNGPDDRNDAFKLAQISGSTVTAPVPEPATWAMMILGFGAIGAAMRRRRSRGTTTPHVA